MPRRPTGKPKGQPRKFQTAEEFEEMAVRYVEHCRDNGEFPNIAGFCVFCDMSDDTFYRLKEYYCESYKKVQMLLENAAINSRFGTDTWRIFYVKNKFGYQVRIQNDVSVADTIEALFENKSLKF